MCVRTLKRLLKRISPRKKEEALVPPAPALRKRHEKESWLYRVVRTGRGGPNMPKRQRCPKCSKNSKRGAKTMGGAYYICPNDGEFFVRAP